MTKYLNHEAFDIITNDAAYWIGFLFADGSVFQQQRGGAPFVQLRLSEIDRGQLEHFRQFLDSTHAITTSPPGNFGGYQSRASVRYTVSSRRLAGRLLELGRYEGPIAPELTVSRHFWRGVVDGDGSIYTLKAGYSGISLVGSQDPASAYGLNNRASRRSLPGQRRSGVPIELVDYQFCKMARSAHLVDTLVRAHGHSARQIALSQELEKCIEHSCSHPVPHA